MKRREFIVGLGSPDSVIDSASGHSHPPSPPCYGRMICQTSNRAQSRPAALFLLGHNPISM